MDVKIPDANLTEKALVDQSEVENNSMHKNVLDRETELKENDVDDRPVAKRVHQFYFAKFYEDQELKERIEAAESLIPTFYEDRYQITREIEGLKFDQCGLDDWKYKESHLSCVIARKKDELKSLQQALNRSGAQNANRGRRNGLYSTTKDSKKENSDDIKFEKSHYRMLHESKNLAEEKKILREMKQFEGTREQQLQATTAQQLLGAREGYGYDGFECTKKTNSDSSCSRKAIREQIRLKEIALDGLRKKLREVRAKIISVKQELEDKKKNIVALEKEMSRLYQQKSEVRDYIFELKKQNEQQDEAVNSYYYEYLSVMNHARDLAEKKDLAALEDLSRKEGDKFMSQWSSNNDFKKEYEKRILPSLDRRQLSSDGRRKTPKGSLRLQRLHQKML